MFKKKVLLKTNKFDSDFQLWTKTPQTTVVLACLIGQFGLIWWEKTFDGAYFFLVRATKKIKTVLDQKIPQKNYRRSKSCLSVLEHLKK